MKVHDKVDAKNAIRLFIEDSIYLSNHVVGNYDIVHEIYYSTFVIRIGHRTENGSLQENLQNVWSMSIVDVLVDYENVEVPKTSMVPKVDDGIGISIQNYYW